MKKSKNNTSTSDAYRVIGLNAIDAPKNTNRFSVKATKTVGTRDLRGGKK